MYHPPHTHTHTHAHTHHSSHWEAAIIKYNFQTEKLGPIFFLSYSYSDNIKLGPEKIVENIRFWAISGFGPETPFFVLFFPLFIYGMALNPMTFNPNPQDLY